MQLDTFNATLNHAGNLLHGIPLVGVSVRELRYLRDLHGEGNIADVKKVGAIEVDEREHYFNIARKYGSHEDATRQEMVVKRIEKLFGVELGDFHQWLDAEMEKVDVRAAGLKAESAAVGQAGAANLAERIRAEEREKLAKSLGLSIEDMDALAAKAPEPQAPQAPAAVAAA